MATTTSIATIAGTTDGNNATADDGTFTPAFGTSSSNQQWKFGTTGTSLSIPSGATINGIEINCEVNTNSYGVAPEAQIKGDVGSHTAFSSAKTANSWPTGKGATVINNCWGGSTDLWGLSWGVTEATSVMCEIDFTTMTSGKIAFFDYFSVTVYYTSGYGNDINGVASANIGKVDGVATANIEKIIGV